MFVQDELATGVNRSSLKYSLDRNGEENSKTEVDLVIDVSLYHKYNYFTADTGMGGGGSFCPTFWPNYRSNKVYGKVMMKIG